MKKLVGIVSPAKMYETENSREDMYNFGNNYAKRVFEAGGIPLGILPKDGYITEEVLDKFDAFLFCGGTKTWPYHFQVLEHAIKNDKPVLGICLGMQAIHRAFKLMDWMEETGFEGPMHEAYAAYGKGKESPMLQRVEGHHNPMFRGREDESKHAVKLLPGSHIQRLTGQDVIYGGTFHKWRAFDPSPRLTVSGVAEDGTIEIVEYGEKILGVQFHPEIDTKLMPIFDVVCK